MYCEVIEANTDHVTTQGGKANEKTDPVLCIGHPVLFGKKGALL